MVTPRIALRFRDATPAIDTIAAHREVLGTQGAVWWGWWRKEFEPGFSGLFDSLDRDTPGWVVILDTSTRRAFLAEYLQATRNLEAVDDLRVPSYYRGSKTNVSGWLLLREIREHHYDESLAERIGATTLLNLDGSGASPKLGSSTYQATTPRSCILHLSDLHFGADYAFLPPDAVPSIGEQRKTLTRCLFDDLSRVGLQSDIGLIVVTGDFTTQGDWSDRTRQQILNEFASLLDKLGLSQQQLVSIPGNHDVIRYPPGSEANAAAFVVEKQSTYQHERDFRTFQEDLTGRHWKDPLNRPFMFSLNGVDVVLCALNSCTIAATQWTEYGYVGVAGTRALAAVGAHRPRGPTVKMMALHHHLLPVSRVEVPHSKGVSLTLDAVELLDAARDAGIQIAIHGHQHLHRVCTYERLAAMGNGDPGPLMIISGGSSGAASTRLPGSERNTYSVIRVRPDELWLSMRELRFDGMPGAELFNRALPVRPVRP